MADQPSGTDTETGDTVAPAAVADRPAEIDNATLLAELEAGGAEVGEEPAAATEPESNDAEVEPGAAAGEVDDAEEPGDEPPAEDLDDEDEEPELEPDEEDDEDAVTGEIAKDPATKARLDAVRRTEERSRQRLAQERASLEQERQQHAVAIQKMHAFDQLAARAKYDMPSVLRALGITDADFEYHAQSLMAYSPKFADKPEYQAAAARAMREREAFDKASAAERRAADVEAKLAERDQAAAAERDLNTLLGRAIRKVAAADGAPITKALAKSSGKAARDALTYTTAELFQKLGRLPTSKELIAAHEAKEARALKLRGLAPPAVAAPAAKGKPAPSPASAPAPNGKPATPAKPAPGAKPAPAPAAARPAPAPAPAAIPPPKPGERGKIPTVEELMHELQSGGPPPN